MSTVVQMTSGSYQNVICPDNTRRTFFPNGQTINGDVRGYVQVKGTSVAGYIRGVGRGYRFYPNIEGKHLALVRPRALPINSRVRLKDGRMGTVMGVVWRYVTPSYRVRLDPMEVTGDHLTAIS